MVKPALTAEEWKAGRVWFRDRRDAVERQDPTKPVTYASMYDSYGIELEHGTPNTKDAPMLSAFDGSWSAYIHSTTRHATAALCLYGQPFGFRKEDVGKLRDEAVSREGIARLDESWKAAHMEYVRWLLDLADRIAALLPPEEP